MEQSCVLQNNPIRDVSMMKNLINFSQLCISSSILNQKGHIHHTAMGTLYYERPYILVVPLQIDADVHQIVKSTWRIKHKSGSQLKMKYSPIATFRLRLHERVRLWPQLIPFGIVHEPEFVQSLVFASLLRFRSVVPPEQSVAG
jgi:hypothetical protein